jgi:CheY-like chemotaxis protein
MSSEAAPALLRILLIEDDPDDFILVRDALRELGDPRLMLDWVEDADEAITAMASGSMTCACWTTGWAPPPAWS